MMNFNSILWSESTSMTGIFTFPVQVCIDSITLILQFMGAFYPQNAFQIFNYILLSFNALA